SPQKSRGIPTSEQSKNELLGLVHLDVIHHHPIFALLRSWNPFRFLRRPIDRVPLLSVLPAKLSSIPVPTPAARLQPAGVPAASPGRLPPAQDSSRPGLCPSGVGQPQAVARRARRLSEDLLAHASRSCRAQPTATAAA